MAAFDFPSGPVLDQIYTHSAATFRYNGYAWVCQGTIDWDIGDATDVIVSPTVMGESNVQDALEDLAAADTGIATSITGKVAKAGDTMTGLLTLSGDPVNPLHAVTKQYVDAGGLADAYTKAESDARFVNVTGDSVSGALNTTGIVNTGTFSSSGAATFAGSITGALSAQFNTLSVTGTSSHTGLATFTAGFNSNANSTVSGQLAVTGNSWVGGRHDVVGILTTTGNFLSANGSAQPSVGCYHSGRNSNLGIWNYGGGGTYLAFGAMDGGGNPLQVWGLMSNSEFFNYGRFYAYSGYMFQNNDWGFAFNTSNFDIDVIGGGAGRSKFRASDGAFITNGFAFKPGGGLWLDSVSDRRAKNVIEEYRSGLQQIKELRPVRYTFKGNDTYEEPVNTEDTVPYLNSTHRQVAINKTPFIGLIAQDAELSMPELVTKAAGYIDGKAVTDLRNMDTTPIIYALINAVKELSAKIEALEARD